MDNEDVIREQMEGTRTALTDKLETLETQVAGSVHEATTNVAETVEAVRDTVQETVTTVKETFAAVKESMRESVNKVKGFFDIADHVDNHPWALMGGSVVLGYALGSLLRPAARQSRQGAGEARSGQERHSSRAYSNDRREDFIPEPSSGGWLSTFGPEIAKLKSLALGSLMGAVGEMIHDAVPPHLGSSLDEIFASITEKVTGTPAAPKRQDREFPS
jgi:ElaB/YqjD/DUF883 family membrane-anchored ribosome-binding protein